MPLWKEPYSKALQISFYFISSVCINYVKKMPFGNSGNISSAVMEQSQKKQKNLLAYDRIYVVPSG